MAKARNFRFDAELCGMADERMAKERRRGSLNSYLEEILYNFFNGHLIDYEKERPRLELELLRGLKGRTVTGVGTIRPVLEHDEGKRKAAS